MIFYNHKNLDYKLLPTNIADLFDSLENIIQKISIKKVPQLKLKNLF